MKTIKVIKEIAKEYFHPKLCLPSPDLFQMDEYIVNIFNSHKLNKSEIEIIKEQYLVLLNVLITSENIRADTTQSRKYLINSGDLSGAIRSQKAFENITLRKSL